MLIIHQVPSKQKYQNQTRVLMLHQVISKQNH
jgi:hypothetical protein